MTFVRPMLLLLATACIFSGCAQARVDVTKTAKGHFEATRADVIEILRTLPDRPYIEIATISSSGWRLNQTAKMHNSLRAKAAGAGANAVVLTDSGINRTRYSAYKWATGVAIKYK